MSWKEVLLLFGKKEAYLLVLTSLGVYLLGSGVNFLGVPSGGMVKGLTADWGAAPVLNSSLSEAKSVSGEALLADAKPIIIKKYLTRWNSPLAKYSDLLVSASYANGVDPNLVVAIARKETGLGRAGHQNCFNAWGWAQTKLYTRCFVSWEDGIRKFTREFADNYIKRGLVTPTQIMTRYNPGSPNGAWAIGVDYYLNELQEYTS